MTTDENGTQQILGLEISVFIASVITAFVLCLLCVVSVAVCLCRRDSQRAAAAIAMGQGLGPGQMAYQSHLTMQTSSPALGHPATYTNATTTPTGQIGPLGTPTAQGRFATLPLNRQGEKPPPPYTGAQGNAIIPAVGNHILNHNHVGNHVGNHIGNNVGNNHIGNNMLVTAGNHGNHVTVVTSQSHILSQAGLNPL